MQELTRDERKQVNQYARERMKLKLLADIRTDLMICELEGWDKREYLQELQGLITSFKVDK